MLKTLARIFTACLILLAANAFAAADVNRASQAELESIAGIGPAMSSRIIDQRSKAAFKDWADLMARVKGIGEHTAAKLSAAGLTVNGASFDAGVQRMPKPAQRPAST